MKFDFTPGPWDFSPAPHGWAYYLHQAEDAEYTPGYSDVGDVGKLPIAGTCTGEYKATQEANARLIAAAPEMVEALIGATIECINTDATTYGWGLPKAIERNREYIAVIEKATGKTWEEINE